MSYIKNVNANLKDTLGNEVEVGLFGGLKVSQSNTQISIVFNKPLNTVKETKVSANGVASQVNRSLLQVGNFIGDSFVESIDVLRYKTAQTVENYFTASFSRPALAGEIATIGGYDAEDGVFLGYVGADFVVGYRNVHHDGTGTAADVTQVVNMAAYDLTKIYRYRIKFGYLGVGNISYEVYDGSKWNLLHTFITDGTLGDRTHVGTAILPMRCDVTDTVGDLHIHSGSWNAQTYGANNGQQEEPFFSQGTRTVSTAAGENSPLVAFKSSTSFGGYTNKVKSELVSAEFATGSEGLYRINMYAYPAGTITTGTFTDLYTGESSLQINTGVTTIPAGGRIAFSTSLAVPSSGTGVASSSIDFTKLGMRASPGDEFLITKECIIAGGGDDTTTWNIAYIDLF